MGSEYELQAEKQTCTKTVHRTHILKNRLIIMQLKKGDGIKHVSLSSVHLLKIFHCSKNLASYVINSHRQS